MTIREAFGVDGLICWCFLCEHRIVRRAHEAFDGITKLMDGDKLVGLAHHACAKANGGKDEPAQ